jgi:hypothetical protein
LAIAAQDHILPHKGSPPNNQSPSSRAAGLAK